MEILIVKIGELPETVGVRQHDQRTATLDALFGGKSLEGPVDMDRRQPGRVGDLILGQRQRQVLQVKTLRSQTCGHLTKQVSYSGPSVALPDIDCPLSKDGRVDEERARNRLRHGGPLREQRAKVGMMYPRDNRLVEDLDRVVCNRKKQMIEVDRVAWNVDGKDLSLTI
jgi:hypothetical protein